MKKMRSKLKINLIILSLIYLAFTVYLIVHFSRLSYGDFGLYQSTSFLIEGGNANEVTLNLFVLLDVIILDLYYYLPAVFIVNRLDNTDGKFSDLKIFQIIRGLFTLACGFLFVIYYGQTQKDDPYYGHLKGVFFFGIVLSLLLLIINPIFESQKGFSKEENSTSVLLPIRLSALVVIFITLLKGAVVSKMNGFLWFLIMFAVFVLYGGFKGYFVMSRLIDGEGNDYFGKKRHLWSCAIVNLVASSYMVNFFSSDGFLPEQHFFAITMIILESIFALGGLIVTIIISNEERNKAYVSTSKRSYSGYVGSSSSYGSSSSSSSAVDDSAERERRKAEELKAAKEREELERERQIYHHVDTKISVRYYNEHEGVWFTLYDADADVTFYYRNYYGQEKTRSTSLRFTNVQYDSISVGDCEYRCSSYLGDY